jgi:hypothetical protein
MERFQGNFSRTMHDPNILHLRAIGIDNRGMIKQLSCFGGVRKGDAILKPINAYVDEKAEMITTELPDCEECLRGINGSLDKTSYGVMKSEDLEFYLQFKINFSQQGNPAKDE